MTSGSSFDKKEAKFVEEFSFETGSNVAKAPRALFCVEIGLGVAKLERFCFFICFQDISY